MSEYDKELQSDSKEYDEATKELRKGSDASRSAERASERPADAEDVEDAPRQ
jgi:hypothetical protein